jgi:hypothetical protein
MDILRSYISFDLNSSLFFNVSALKPEFAPIFFSAKRDGLVTEDTFNEMWFEGCNEMKKVSSCLKGTSKLFDSENKVLGLTRVISHFYIGSTLSQRGNGRL